MRLNKAARNERRKLTANLFNAVASGTILAALVGPFIGMGLGTFQPRSNLLNVLGLSLLGVVLAFMIHRIARDILRGMEE